MKPMLAQTGDPSGLSYPVAVQIKYDGIRCCVVDGVAVSRSLKPIQNKEIQRALGHWEFNGLDGELIVGRPEAPGCMQATSSFVMAPNKTGADWGYYIFDKWDESGGYANRWDALFTTLMTHSLQPWALSTRMLLVKLEKAENEAALLRYEERAVAEGHEGVIIRTLSEPYKFGRSGKSGPLLKIKRFTDFEAEVIGVYEKMHNANEAVRNALGRTERSTKKAGLEPLDTLGGLILRAVNGPWEGVEFRCGTGFDDALRDELWRITNPLSEWPLAKIKAVEIGAKDAPRFPVFLGFRNEDDL